MSPQVGGHRQGTALDEVFPAQVPWRPPIARHQFVARPTDGDRIEVRGCDLWTFRDGLIARETRYYTQPFEAPAWRSQWVERMATV